MTDPLTQVVHGIRATHWLSRFFGGLFLAEKHANHVAHTKSYVCKMQAQLAQFVLLAGLLHKKLREQLEACQKNQIDADALEKAIKDLADFITRYQMTAARDTLQAVAEHFSHKAKKKAYHPRLCIKLCHANGVYTLLRHKIKTEAQAPESISTARESNTGFDTVLGNATTYLENNIPKRALTGDYKNPRLLVQPAKQYKTKLAYRIKRIFTKAPDLDWIACWTETVGSAKSMEPEACYKSTLIVPMTLMHSDLEPSFLDFYGANAATHDEKLTFGFLCTDCHDVDFFDELDKEHLYVFADLFSLFLIHGNNLREYSQTYIDAIEMVNTMKRKK